MKAYILVGVRAGKIRGVVEKVRAVAGVKTAHACWGRPDVIAMVDVQDAGTLADTVLTKIQGIEGVESTDTRIVIE
jgi:DNA-binding Lrp family transcriptional regulator